eukprot:GEMP01007417.1.p1 GENE.GEMP01007417.1~~GEMP01007417.1.p1  ORF type:complete len:869 (+),score=146.61 GEMP01007417.1:97-2607(+)
MDEWRAALDGASSQKHRRTSLEWLRDEVKSRRVCDLFPVDQVFYDAVLLLWFSAAQWLECPDTEACHELFDETMSLMVSLPEWALRGLGSYVYQELYQRMGRAKRVGEKQPFRRVLHDVYLHEVQRRPDIRSEIGKALRSFIPRPSRALDPSFLVGFLGDVIRGFQSPAASHEELYKSVLLELHKPDEWFSWDRQIAWVNLYHKDLLFCLKLYLDRDPKYAFPILETLLRYWPSFRHACTPKEVVFLYEVGIVCEYVSVEMLERWNSVEKFTLRLFVALQSLNANTLESVLQLWKSPHFIELTKAVKKNWFGKFIPAIIADGELFWNPTVNRMKALVLKKFEKIDPELFESVAESTFNIIAKTAPKAAHRVPIAAPLPDMSASQTSKGPSVTVTGVAPWARQRPVFRGMPAPGAPSAKEPETGIERMHAYIEKCNPQADSSFDTRPWETALNLPTVTYLPDLKFHQLVFGRDLGTGAFGTVRYARAVERGKTQSEWAEYAVKIISLETIKEYGYEANINREICVLKHLSHPTICRMVSSFQMKSNAYLVLEFGSGGDLHNYILARGVLAQDVSKFVAGEIVSGLVAIHDAGFLFGDLKPENCVITSRGHIKLTDFGGARPLTPDAREKTAERLLERLRDGSYRFGKEEDDEVEEEHIESDAVELEDLRLEGTTLYMAPELVKGKTPTFAADSWSLGCTLHFCLTKKPPLWSEDDEELQNRIVQFDVMSLSANLLPEAATFIGKLMALDPEKRLSMAMAATDEWFGDTNVFDLYKLEGILEQGSFDPIATDDPWTKRQFSKIWTHMPSPTEYGDHNLKQAEAFDAITETESERDSMF